MQVAKSVGRMHATSRFGSACWTACLHDLISKLIADYVL